MDDIINERKDNTYWFTALFDSIVEHESLDKVRHAGRLVREDALKMKDMREKIFGKYSETIPMTENSRHASIPVSSSTARPVDTKTDNRVWTYAPGKKLEGHMIMRPERAFNYSLGGRPLSDITDVEKKPLPLEESTVETKKEQ